MLHKPLWTTGRRLPVYAVEVPQNLSLFYCDLQHLQDPHNYYHQLYQPRTTLKQETPCLLKCLTNGGRNFWGEGTGKARVIEGYQEGNKSMISILAAAAENNWRNSLSILATRQYLNWNQHVKLPVAICASNVFLTFLDGWSFIPGKGSVQRLWVQ